MDKLKRYIGLFVALSFLGIGFTPSPRTWNLYGQVRYYPEKISQLDDTIAGDIAARLGNDSSNNKNKFYFWKIATDYFNTCRPFKAISIKRRIFSECMGHPELFMLRAGDYMQELEVLEPKYPEMAKQYGALFRPEKERELERMNPAIEDQIMLTKFREPRYQLETQMGSAIAKYLKAQQLGLATTIYLFHAAWVAVFLLLVRQRALVGGLIFAPFTLMFGAGKEVAKAAKNAHDKV